MWPNPVFSADLVTFTKEILNGKLHFLCNARLGAVKFDIPRRSFTVIKSKVFLRKTPVLECLFDLVANLFCKIHRKTPVPGSLF